MSRRRVRFRAAFRTGSGALMVAGSAADGTTTYGPEGVAILNGSNTITSTDIDNDFFTRDQVTNFATTPVTTRPETIYANAVAGTARQGYRWRVPGPVVNSAGVSVNVPEFVQLPLAGTGMTVTGLPNANPAAARFSLSVNKP